MFLSLTNYQLAPYFIPKLTPTTFMPPPPPSSPSSPSSAEEKSWPSSMDLNLVPLPKLEPKPEPVEIACSPELHAPLQQLLPADDALLSQYLRLARLFLSSVAGHHHSLSPLPSSSSAAAATTATTATTSSSSSSSSSIAMVAASAKKRKVPRSSEVVRVASLSPRDQFHFRGVVRRTRLTFESLRSVFFHNHEPGHCRSRPDLKAAALMGEKGLWLNRDRRIVGAIPGVCVGDIFFFRMELCVIGLHGQVQAGIDYVSASRSSSGEPIATSIIVSGGYEDNDDAGVELVYTGHGGRSNGRQCGQQKLEGGNLGLEKSKENGIEIRVIRGIKSERSPTNKIYVYDGLYKIVESWFDSGRSGFGVYKYRLVRTEGQEEMGSSIMKLAENLKVNPLIARPKGYWSLDISMGKENFPVMLFNDIDEGLDPLIFEYLARPIYPTYVFHEKIGGGCDCVSDCSVDCYCAILNGGVFPYDANGLLLRGKPLIYECGMRCSCPPSCPNRVSQMGLRHRFEIFRSKETGWGVRSLDLIRAGAFVCEFSGVVVTKEQSKANGEGMIWPNRFPGRWVEWGDISDFFPGYMPPNFPNLPDLSFSIDVSRPRNVACYISHGTSPNVFVQFVLFDHYNNLYPHLMIFAMENIPPMRELSIDYGVGDEWVEQLTM